MSNLNTIQIARSKILRTILKAPFYVSGDTIRTVKETVKRAYRAKVHLHFGIIKLLRFQRNV